MHTGTLVRAGSIVLAAGVMTGIQAAGAIAGPSVVHVDGTLKVTTGGPPVCHNGICVIGNGGSGTMTPYGQVTFTTKIIADGNQPPCGKNSQWVNRIIRTIHTGKGTIVLHEAGLQCPQPGVGPRVDAIWTLDGTDSTGIFAGATGNGTDVAYPVQNTAAPTGRITLTS